MATVVSHHVSTTTEHFVQDRGKKLLVVCLHRCIIVLQGDLGGIRAFIDLRGIRRV